MGNQGPAAEKTVRRAGKTGEDGKNMRRFGHSSLSYAPSGAFFRVVLPISIRMFFRGVSA
jgi:hypothetical protein